MKTATEGKKVKTVPHKARRPSVTGSPTVNLMSQAVKASQAKKQNFSQLLNNWENLSTPAVFFRAEIEGKMWTANTGEIRKSVEN